VDEHLDAPLVLRVNGAMFQIIAPASRTLLEVLREDLGLVGTKHGCELGECGACTVLIDGEPALACLILPIEVQGREITTVEGLAGADLHPLQQAFVEQGALQCGYCTPGMVLAAMALLDRTPAPTREEISEALAGNLCRCTGYHRIVAAVAAAAAVVRRE